MKNVAVLTEDGAFALFFHPHPGGFDSSRVPTPGNLPYKANKMLIHTYIHTCFIYFESYTINSISTIFK